MSVEKEAAFRDTILKAVRDAKRHHVMAGKDTGFSLLGTILDVAAHNDAYGARAAQRGFKQFQRGVNIADTAAGAALRGEAKRDSLRYKLWTDKDYIPVGKGRYIHSDRPSISAPFKFISGPVTGTLALMKGDEIIANMQNKQEEVPQYEY
jgi:hypothetical protein